MFSSSMISEAYGHGTVDLGATFTGPFNAASLVEPFFTPSGQTFTPTVSSLAAVDVFISAPGSTGLGGGPDTITVTVWDSSTPGTSTICPPFPLGCGSASANVDTSGFSVSNPLLVHIHFNPPISLGPGVNSLTFSQGAATTRFLASSGNPYSGGVFWTGNPLTNFDFGFTNYFCIPNCGVDEGAIGGTIIPVESISLLVTGIHATSAWLIPILVSAVGFGIVLVRRK